MDDINKSPWYQHYVVFQGLLLLGFLFHQTEDWGNRPFAFLSYFGVAAFAFLPKWRQWIFTAIITLATYRYLDLFPNLANHSNFNLLVYLLLFPIQWQIHTNKTVDYKNLFYCLRWLIFVLYFFTIFHKLNWDFINPQSSCASQKLDDYYRMIPHHWSLIRYWFYASTPALGLIVEGIIPLFLFFGRTRFIAIPFVAILHFTLAPMGFTDFSSLAMSFAWCFINPSNMSSRNLLKHFQYLVIASLLLSSSLFPFRFPKGIQAYEIYEGFVFSLIYSVFIYKYYLKNISKESLLLPKALWQKALIVFLFFFGMNSYLGLRTAGNFSMFSNLRTEGSTSNHILLSSNPLKIFSFQEDTIEVLKVSRKARGFYKHMPMAGQLIPRVEFQRILQKIRKRKWTRIHLKVRYKDQEYETKHAGFDPGFSFPVPEWQIKLMKFRHIQKEGPQWCQW